jgi:hypothetical protein
MSFSSTTTSSSSFNTEPMTQSETYIKEMERIDIIRSLYVDKRCAWPDCHISDEFESLEEFTETHLDSEHSIEMHERVQRDLLKQIKQVTRLELELSQSRALLAGMLGHIDAQVKQGKKFVLHPADVNEVKEEIEEDSAPLVQKKRCQVDQEVDVRVTTNEMGVQSQIETRHVEIQVVYECKCKAEKKDNATQFDEHVKVEKREIETQVFIQNELVTKIDQESQTEEKPNFHAIIQKTGKNPNLV